MTEFLSHEEIAELCGTRGVQAQARYLIQNEIPFRFGGKRIYVLRAVMRDIRAPSEARLDLVR